MRATGGVDRRSEALPGSGATLSAGCLAQKPPLEILPDSNHIYDLRHNSSDSNVFYAETAKFADSIVARIDQLARPILDGYCRHLHSCNVEAPRSHGEYVIELLTLGMAVRRCETAAQTTPPWAVLLAQGLILLRRRVPIFKHPADWLRARLSSHFFLPTIHRTQDRGPLTRGVSEHQRVGSPPARLSQLIGWLSATGEYEQESIRLRNWRNYLNTLSPHDARHCMNIAVESFDDFARRAASKLGRFTEGVERFLSGEYAHRPCREDQIFCGRPPVEYHLNILAAEVMNRGLQDSFEGAARKVVLVPGCMRGRKAGTCKARVDGVDLTCMACDLDCAVNRIAQRMRKLGAKVYVVPHTTGFSQWLDRWQREPGVGVVAVACMLNILPGGYEMRSRSIASQCVPLDYPGCRKHWDLNGFPTAVNEDRLVQIVMRARA
jgi:uncharacterized protein